jgi:hypothetical protein
VKDDKSLNFQLAQRFADRHARHLVGIGKGFLTQGFTGCQFIGQDARADPGCELVDDGSRFDRI